MLRVDEAFHRGGRGGRVGDGLRYDKEREGGGANRTKRGKKEVGEMDEKHLPLKVDPGWETLSLILHCNHTMANLSLSLLFSLNMCKFLCFSLEKC